MNILSHQDMVSREKELLHLYNNGDIKFKLNLQQLIQYKTKKKDLFCFNKPDENTRILIQKLIPLHKNIQIIKLEEEQNALFKVLGYIFLFIIYKRRDQSSQYFKEHLKCSLYSSDLDLLEVRNHSFNKKMKSDTIKAVIATLFKEIQYLLQTQIVRINKIKPEQLIAFALQQNDIVVEGFHLFYRSILAMLDLENAINCIEDLNPQQALQHLIEYFELDCRIINNLYFFNQAGIFITSISQQILAFGRYYENQLNFQQTSDEETQTKNVQKIPQLQLNLPKKMISTDTQIQKEDVKIFNFLLDTDRNSSCMEESFNDNKSQQNVTPSFQHNEELKFGRKTDRSTQHNLNKIKDRIHNEKINQISSEQEEITTRQQISQSFNEDLNKQNNLQNRFLNLKFDDSRSVSEAEAAPTPVLGGNQIFRFGKIEPPPKIYQFEQNFPNIQLQTPQKNSIDQQAINIIKNNTLLIQTKDIKQSAIRRQSYQGQNSSQSISSDNLKRTEMKTSKNQIQVIDQTASRASLVNNYDDKKISQEILNARKVTMAHCQQTSSYSNCTCHLEKKARFKLSSQIICMTVNTNNQKQHTLQNYGRSVTNQLTLNFQKKLSPINQGNQRSQSKKILFKTNSNKSTQNLKGEVKKQRSPVKEHKQHQKSQQFINFLKKDKSQLIKKLTQKRNAKNQIGSGQINLNKFTEHNKNNQGERRFIKQSMFVGSYNFQNPQKFMNGRMDKNRSISPHYSIDKNTKKKCQVRGRSKTPNNGVVKNQFKTDGFKLIPTSNKNNSKQKQLTPVGQYSSQGNIGHLKVNFVTTNVPKPPISIRIPVAPLNNPPNLTPTNLNKKGFEVNFKK